jgi:anti-sigma factor RsiW
VTEPGRPISEEELHAYVDDRLDAERRPAVLRYLQEHADVAQRIAAYSAQREGLRAALAPLAAEPVPPQLDLQRLMQQRLGRRQVHWRIAASVLVAFGVGGSAGWLLRARLTPMPPNGLTVLTQDAVANHVVFAADRRRPTELGAEQRDDLARWVSNRLNRPVAPPDLSALGYSYMGGRLAATARGPAALFMYDDGHGVRISVFVRPMVNSTRTTPIQQLEVGDIGGCAWVEKGVGYTVVGAVPVAELQRLADYIHAQLTAAT